MDSTIRKILWGAFVLLTLLVLAGLTININVLMAEKRQEYRIVHEFGPLLEKVKTMDSDEDQLLAAARAYVLTGQTQFLQQYADSIREFNKTAVSAGELVEQAIDRQKIATMVEHFNRLRVLCDQQVEMVRAGNAEAARASVLRAAEVDRVAPDNAGLLTDSIRRRQAVELEMLSSRRQRFSLLLILVSATVILMAWLVLLRIERSLNASIGRQVRRTEEMIAGMPDGVMLVDAEGRVVFVNPAAQKFLGTSVVGVGIDQQPSTYGFHTDDGREMDAREVPAALALSTGRAVQDVAMRIAREDGRSVGVSMSATPLREDHRTSGAIVTFRDTTERRRLEEETLVQAERAQILADAGSFFASNIDPVWVTQAIAERVAEVLGDWAAVILKTSGSNELRVASIHHRDMASLGLAWSYIYRQPLTVGEGLIGQVISTGYPSLTTNLSAPSLGKRESSTYHAVQMKLASLLILPLRTRREILGALVIAAHDPDRQMTDEKLPLAEQLAERAALAVENAKLYTDQVEARRKVEDLSRLKDEFLSIASHELRTPVTSIKGYTQLAKTLILENDLVTSGQYLDVALDQIDRMSRLILELLDVSRIETGRLEIRREPIEWSPFVSEVVQSHHTAVSDRRILLDVPDDPNLVSGDRDRLQQVLGNLIENAVKYSPDGGEVYVTVRTEGDRIVTSVCDRGIGIPSDELALVFERFHRGRQVSSTNYGGLGLGLYITKQIVERHGGSIWVESREGLGTTFHFALPVAPAEVTV
jgi:PAS domain S-box-containing protein